MLLSSDNNSKIVKFYPIATATHSYTDKENCIYVFF